MKKTVTLLIIWGCIISLSAQQTSFVKQSLVINVEVPVRVFDGSVFLDNLTLKDFEVYENGIPQKIEAVYLIKERSIERSEEKQRFNPELERNFFLFFELADYSPRVGEALSFFINEVINPGDNLLVTTPLRTYRFRGKSLERRSRPEIIKELTGLIREDVWEGNSEYRNALKEIEQAAQALAAELAQGNENIPVEVNIDERDPNVGFDTRLMHYAQLLSRLENLRYADQYKLLDFARYLKAELGQKYVFIFYQKEFIPQIDPKILSRYLYTRQDDANAVMSISELMGLTRREHSIDTDLIKRSYADASTSIHFIFFTPTPNPIHGVRLQEQSEDIFNIYSRLSEATGGIMLSSANLARAFQQALDASKNYYLLYYTPKDYEPDGKFKTIEVKVKNPGYRVTYRSGYFAF